MDTACTFKMICPQWTVSIHIYLLSSHQLCEMQAPTYHAAETIGKLWQLIFCWLFHSVSPTSRIMKVTFHKQFWLAIASKEKTNICHNIHSVATPAISAQFGIETLSWTFSEVQVRINTYERKLHSCFYTKLSPVWNHYLTLSLRRIHTLLFLLAERQGFVWPLHFGRQSQNNRCRE